MVVSFDFIPRSAAPTSPPHIVAVSRSGDIELSVIRDSPRHKWSPRGELLASVGSTYKVYQTHSGFDDNVPQDPWEIQFRDETKSPLKNMSTLQQEAEPTAEPSNQNLIVQASAPRKYSPSSILRMPFRPGPGSSISTPRPLSVPLDSEETTVPKVEVTAPKPPLSKPPSHSRGRSTARSEKRSLERQLAQDISMITRRRVLQGYGLESVSANG